MDAEIEAMRAITELMHGLQVDQVRRVLSWANDKFGGQVRTTVSMQESRTTEAANPRPPIFAALADLYDAASPSTEPEKLLVVAYWFQVVQGTGELESQVLNKELKNLGHPVGNITRAFSSLAETTPRLVMQTRKTGSTKQARKRFRLTVEGIRRVGQMLGDTTSAVSVRPAEDASL